MSQARRTDDRRQWTNVLLIVIAALLGVLVLRGGGLPENTAMAKERNAPPNAFAQRIEIIQAVKSLGDEVRALESKLTSATLNVKVVDMPEVRVREEKE